MKQGLLDNYKGPLVYGNLQPKDWLLINALYQGPTRDNGYHDYAYLVMKNMVTGEKRLFTMEDPGMYMYVVKDSYRTYDYYPAYRPLKECEPVKVRYAKVLKATAEIGGDKYKKFLAEASKTRYGLARELYKYPYVLASDYNYVDYMRIEWALHYHNWDIEVSLDKMFLDIEVDTIDIPGFPEPGECPINAVSLIDEKSNSVFVFLLRNKNNPQIAEYEANIEEHKKSYHEAFDETYGELEYRIHFFDSEIHLIDAVFQVINKLKRDICAIWNMVFDIPYIIARIEALGYSPRDIMCSHEFKTPILKFHKDTFQTDFKKRNNWFMLSSYTVFICQMETYIKLRKQRSELKSVKLNAIARNELGDEKLDYSDEADIKTLPYKNYPMFVMYNIKDTLLQLGIERKTNDLTTVFLKTIENATPYQSIFSQTKVLKNHAYMSYFEQGYIIGNNRNLDYSKPRSDDEYKEEKRKKTVEGALVADPMLNKHVGVKMFGVPSMFIFRYVIDFDYSSLYPSIIIAFNIGRETMIGKLILDGFSHMNPDPTDVLYDQGKTFMEALLSKDWPYIGATYFNLPTTEELLEELDTI